MAERSALDLRIDELVLHGFRPADRYEVAAAIERELARLFAGGAPPALFDGARPTGDIDGGSFAVPHGASAADVGAEVARAIHRSLAGAGAAGEPVPRSANPAQAPRGQGR
jgi:hypothetical protein